MPEFSERLKKTKNQNPSMSPRHHLTKRQRNSLCDCWTAPHRALAALRQLADRTMSIQERLWSTVKPPKAVWLWTVYIRNGYGNISLL